MLVYFVISISHKGYTPGKWLLDLKVLTKENEKLSITKSILRESVLKLLSGIFVFIGFICIASSREKKGWHDYIVGSKVIKSTDHAKRTTIWKAVGIISFVVLFGSYTWEISSLIYTGQKMELPKKLINLPFVERNPAEPKDISNIASDTSFVNWLNKNAQSPENFAIQTALNHQITIFGEMHGTKENLDFFNKIIPDLYHKSGVRCIAMECIPSSMNEKLKELVNGKEFSAELALWVARNATWKIWGFKEYWDVIETVWKLNKSLSENSPKMRIMGIDTDWEGPCLAMALPGGSDDGLKNVPLWEKLKIFTSIGDFVKVIYRDELMARNVEKEIIEKGEKGVVWIGSAHSMLHYGYPVFYNNKIQFIKARFGLILNEKYKGNIGQILLWHTTADFKKNENKSMDNFIESIMNKRDNLPIGFNIENSPFGLLRDSTAMYFNKWRSVSFKDITQGLIFLKPLDKLQKCTWTENYISSEMFLKYKLFYELKLEQKISNNKLCNELWRNK